MKEIVILGGPNGAGKTTAARVLHPEFLRLHEFLNADEIAREIAPDRPEAAATAEGRRMIERMRENVHIPAETIIRLFHAGLSDMRALYLPLANTAIYDNSGERRILVAEKESVRPLVVKDAERWSRMEEMTRWKSLPVRS